MDIQLTGEAWHKEMKRRSQDLIRVYNPTEQDYVLVWEDQKFIVPSKTHDKGWGMGMRVMQRYLAQKYTKEIVDKMLMEKMDKLIEERKETFRARGNEDPTYNANIQLQYTTRTDDQKLREPLEDEVWMGIEEEFGVDSESVEIKEEKPMEQKDPFDRLKQKRYTPEKIQEVAPIQEEEKPPLYVSPKYKAKEEKHDA